MIAPKVFQPAIPKPPKCIARPAGGMSVVS